MSGAAAQTRPLEAVSTETTASNSTPVAAAAAADHLAGAVAAGVEQRTGDFRDLPQRAAEAEHPALRGAQVLGAGDDFLTGIATLVEREGAQAVEV